VASKRYYQNPDEVSSKGKNRRRYEVWFDGLQHALLYAESLDEAQLIADRWFGRPCKVVLVSHNRGRPREELN
jgi:hypothetical protein